MIAFCVHCGASIIDEIMIFNGQVLPSRDVYCENCGKLAGVKEELIKKEDTLSDLADKKGEVTVKNGKAN